MDWIRDRSRGITAVVLTVVLLGAVVLVAAIPELTRLFGSYVHVLVFGP